MKPMEKILIKLLPFQHQNFQHEALRLAIDQKELLTHELLEYLERVAKNKNLTNKNSTKYNGFVQAIYILAQFREERSYPLIVKCLRQLDANYPRGHLREPEFGRVLASVCHGDLSLIKSLIEDPTVKIDIRKEALNSIVASYCNGQIERENLISYFQFLLNNKMDKENIVEYEKSELTW